MKTIVALKRAVEMTAGQSPPSDEVELFEGEGLPFLQGNAEFGGRNPVPLYRCDRATRVCNASDILLSIRAPVGALNVADRCYGIGRGLCAIRPKALDQRFLWWLLHAEVEALHALAVGSTYEAVTAEDIGTLRVTVPPLAVQRIIADFLDAETARIDALIEKKQRMVALLEERFESLIWAEVTGLSTEPKRPCSLSWVAEIPARWGTPTVSVNFALQLGKMLNAEASRGAEHYPYLRNTNVQWDRFDLDDLGTMHFDAADRQRCELQYGDVLVCEGGEVGRAAVWTGEVPNCYFQKAIHRVRPRAGANSRYLMYCLRAAAKRSVFAVEGNLSTIVHLTGEQLRVHRFPWPPSNEQQEIVSRLDEAAAQTQLATGALDRQIALLRERRQALITAAVTGDLDIPGVAA